MHLGTASNALIAVLLLFLLGAVFSLLLHKRQVFSNVISNTFSATASVLGLVISLYILLFNSSEEIAFNLDPAFTPFSFSLRIDSLSAFFLLVISLLSIIVSVYSLGYNVHYFNKYNTGVLGFLYNLFIASMVGVVCSGHIFFFLFAWELMSLASYFLVTYDNDSSESQKAGTIYIIMTHVGTAFITAAFTLIYKYTGSTDIASLGLKVLPGNIRSLVFFFLLIGFGTKAGVIPFHIWLPYAHPSAPSNVSALMSGVMIKTAVYGMLRFMPGLLTPEYFWWGLAVVVPGAVSVFLGIAYALMENNLKRLLAYSSIENIGIILICFGLGLTALARGSSLAAAISFAGALLHILNHSLYKGLLFLGAGAIHLSTGTKDLEKLGGLIKRMPYSALLFLAGALSVSAIPPFNGFIGEWLAFRAIFLNIAEAGTFGKIVLILVAAVAAMAGGLAVFCFVKAYGLTFLALPRTEKAANAKEAGPAMLASMGVLAAACALAGIFPGMLIRLAGGILADITGTAPVASGGSFFEFLFGPLEAAGSSIQPAAAAVLLLVIALAILGVALVLSRNTRSRTYTTWDCGYVMPDPRMEYSATGFSKPVRIVLRGIFRPGRQLNIEEGASPYFVKSASYRVSTQPVFEKYIYNPVIKFIFNFARRVRFVIQTGSIHAYLSYIFIAIVLMFIYNALS